MRKAASAARGMPAARVLAIIPCNSRPYVTKAGLIQRRMNAIPASNAPDSNLTGPVMATIRSVNRRHQRAIVATHARGILASTKAADVVVQPKAKPAKASA